jgi:hypothetical protein
LVNLGGTGTSGSVEDNIKAIDNVLGAGQMVTTEVPVKAVKSLVDRGLDMPSL